MLLVAASFRAPMVAPPQQRVQLQPPHVPHVLLHQPVPAAAARGMCTAVHVLGRLGLLDYALAHGSSSDHGMGHGSAASAAVTADLAAARRAAQDALTSTSLLLDGHTSRATMTHGCFLPPLPGCAWPADRPGWFASADEASCAPKLWCAGSGAQLALAAHPVPLPSPILQLSGGLDGSDSSAVVLGALCESRMHLYKIRSCA